MNLGQILNGAPEEAAPQLLGSVLSTETHDGVVGVRVNEVEAYKGSDDPASHAYRGRTERNRSMFEAPGTLYVYKSYGVHWCANVAAGPVGTGWGILFRGGEVVEGLSLVKRRRGREDELTNGPGKLCQALGIAGEDNGTNLLAPESRIQLQPGSTPMMIMATPRVGVSQAEDRAWRFVTAGTVTPAG